ncbi:MAG: PD-(D/E)XK nuclease-like domain-containing protein [Clostridia bacterium]|nr:PD-(D/E)XK nuclease-like domain-containing protein [Clostridia bacterium]
MNKSGIVIETNAEYHGYREAISKSRLANMSVCPAYFKWCEDNPQEPSEDMVLGSAFHKIVLEPETFYNEFAVMPNVDRRTTQGKMKYAEFIIEADGKTVITQEQYDTICGMRDSIMSNPYARKLINGNIEQSMYFTDDLTKVECKCRPDVWRKVADRVVITDLKSAKSVMPNDFMRDCVKYHYDLQTAMYREGVSKTLNMPKDNIDFVFIAVEKKPPYLLNIMQADTYVIQKGEADFREFIGTYAECKADGVFYGLNGKNGIINNLSLPSYLLKNED